MAVSKGYTWSYKGLFLGLFCRKYEVLKMQCFIHKKSKHQHNKKNRENVAQIQRQNKFLDHKVVSNRQPKKAREKIRELFRLVYFASSRRTEFPIC